MPEVIPPFLRILLAPWTALARLFSGGEKPKRVKHTVYPDGRVVTEPLTPENDIQPLTEEEFKALQEQCRIESERRK